MKRLRLSKRNFIWFLCCAGCAVMALVLLGRRNALIGRQESQLMAQRWSSKGGVSQISCFFSANSRMTVNSLIEFEHNLDNALLEASIESESENEDARLWADAYSAPGMLYLSTEKGSVSVNALGVGGDFFLFHPQKLLSGGYFSGSNLNQDYILIDEETAWQLYGAVDIAGKVINAGQKPLVISGVIRRPQGRMEKAAGLANSIVYVSYSVLEEQSGVSGPNHYEIVMPDPIRDFAMQRVKENLRADENETVFIENTNRYSMAASFRLLKEFGTRSMNGKAIIYPYWENLARGYEDVIALLTLCMTVCAAVPALTLFVCLIRWWRKKPWTVKGLWEKLADRLRILRERHYAKKQNAKSQKKDFNQESGHGKRNNRRFLSGKQKVSESKREETQEDDYEEVE